MISRIIVFFYSLFIFAGSLVISQAVPHVFGHSSLFEFLYAF